MSDYGLLYPIIQQQPLLGYHCKWFECRTHQQFICDPHYVWDKNCTIVQTSDLYSCLLEMMPRVIWRARPYNILLYHERYQLSLPTCVNYSKIYLKYSKWNY